MSAALALRAAKPRAPILQILINALMKSAIIAAVLLCTALIGGGVYYAVEQSKPGPRSVALSPLYEARLKEGGWVRGNAQSSVTVVEYADFQCPACQAFNPIVNKAFEQTKDKAKFVFKSYPLTSIHDKARTAAIGAEAAGRQGKFWEMEALLYDNQTSWSVQNDSQFRTIMAGYAESIGLNVEQFKRDLKDSSTADGIENDTADGNKIPLQGTPTIVINGKALASAPGSTEELVALINAALSGS